MQQCDIIFLECNYDDDLLKESNIKAISEVQLSKTLREGTQHLLLQSSLEEMTPNTVFVGFVIANTCRNYNSADR